MTWRDWRDLALIWALYMALWLSGVRTLPEEEEEE